MGRSLLIFIQISQFYLTKFGLAKDRNHLEGRPNAMDADDAQMQQINNASAYCKCKMVTMTTCEAS